METLLADADYRARVARIQETRAIGDQITELSGHINAATYRLLTLIAEFDRRAGWNDGGTRSSTWRILRRPNSVQQAADRHAEIHRAAVPARDGGAGVDGDGLAG